MPKRTETTKRTKGTGYTAKKNVKKLILFVFFKSARSRPIASAIMAALHEKFHLWANKERQKKKGKKETKKGKKASIETQMGTENPRQADENI